MKALISRDLKLSLRQGADSAAALVFFLIAGSLFAFARRPLACRAGADCRRGGVGLRAAGGAVAAGPACLRADFEDGTLDLMLLSGLPAYEVALAKAVAHWLVTGLPLLLVAPVLAVMLRLPGAEMVVLLAGLVPGTMIFSLLGTFSAAVTLGARRASVLMPVITLPLMIPALIFGSSVAGAQHPAAAFYMLGAIFAAALPLAPLGAGLALRAAAE